jgi:DNA mismatch endonuclease (patch repair protein)
MSDEAQSAGPAPRDEHVKSRMRSQRRISTRPEVALRSALHRRGHRYRVGLRVPGLPRRTIDIAFPRRRVAVFVDGCFWHRCPTHFVPVKNNASWWAEKLEANVQRDDETTRALEDLGWVVLRIWEHVPPDEAADVVELALHDESPAGTT